MIEVQVNTNNPKMNIDASTTTFDVTANFTYGGTSGGSDGTFDHSLLFNRNANNQHPISAINGLEDELPDTLTNEDIESILSGFTNL